MRVNFVCSFSFKQYFNEEYFWKKANLGPPFIFLLTSPWWIEGLKSIYWSFRYRSLNQQEILSDRFAWLHERMLVWFLHISKLSNEINTIIYEDDVERIILKKVPDGGFKKDGPALMLGPSYPERLSY
ncbi:putative membrane protein [Cardiosporidium cionae]|uniref:Membrane protein n=1 Tax=Cardiosporidium cionae TaxID=476202 RepID=A0ABQ7J873_9APIC|nr:putative membrane protein [Cardiosporidium cionae]|eukprot:KAF8820192.1 putative membrane protein [Cardiosporidium cionae]